MEIKLSAGDKLNIPENCKAIIEDGFIAIEEAQKETQEEFKDGDILRSKDMGNIVIFKSYENESNYSFCAYYDSSNFTKFCWISSYFRHATEEEKQAFFDDLKAKGLKWNAETKTMEKQNEFKDGDILSISLSNNKTMPFINKGVDERGFYKFYVGLNCYGKAFVCPSEDARWGRDTPVRATEEEKQRLFDKLKEEGLRWNAETKQIEKIRKRAKEGEKYLYVTGIGYVYEFKENYDSDDDRFYNSGNYYLLSEREQAEEDAKAVKAIFEKRLKV